MRRKGAVVSGLVGLAALIGMGAVFVANASPYVTIAEVQSATGENIHVTGVIDKSTLKQNLAAREARFELEDKGERLKVVYRGHPQPNISSATQVVVIGKMEGGEFVANDMLLKCPSKYESSTGGSGTPAY